jgi:hypothetical protein
LVRLINRIIFDLSNNRNMNLYTAYYTDNKTKRKIQLPVTAIDYAAALVVARKLTETYDYRFDDLTWKKYVKKAK